MDNGDGPPLSPAAQQTGEGSGDGQQPQAHLQKQQKHEAPPMYTLPGLEGEVGAAAAACAGLHRGRHTPAWPARLVGSAHVQWTMEQVVEMEMSRDPRLAQVCRRIAPGAAPAGPGTTARPSSTPLPLPPFQVRRSALPPEFWDARRRARNHARLQRNYDKRKRKGEALRQEEAERRAGLSEAAAAEYEAAREAERAAAKAAAAAQRERVAAAMAAGLRVVVDCSLSAGASDREVRSLCKQLELCAAANKRAAAPVSLQFASFAGPIKAFALAGMHADRWPAAAGHEAPLGELFSSGELVVLSPDAEQTLGELEGDKARAWAGSKLPRAAHTCVCRAWKPILAHARHCPSLPLPRKQVYVIGGLVDRTVQKGASLKLVQVAGARAVRLPIAEHLGAGAAAKGRGVLNVNDVFAALLAVHAGQGWAAALEAAIPQRLREAGAQGQPQAQKKQKGAAPRPAQGQEQRAQQQQQAQQEEEQQQAQQAQQEEEQQQAQQEEEQQQAQREQQQQQQQQAPEQVHTTAVANVSVQPPSAAGG